MLERLKSWAKRMLGWLKEFIAAFWNSVLDTFEYVVFNWEATTILLFASFGLTWLLGELPFVLFLPLWIEYFLAMEMVAPLLSVLAIWGLVWNMRRRMSQEFAEERV